jgi:hypothetical protein
MRRLGAVGQHWRHQAWLPLRSMPLYPSKQTLLSVGIDVRFVPLADKTLSSPSAARVCASGGPIWPF